MSNKLPVLTEFPLITSKIQIDSELLSKKSAEMELKRTDEYKSNESIKMGDGIPRRNITKSRSDKVSDIKVVTTSETSNWIKIIGIILFIIIAGSSYYFYVNYRKNKN